MFPEPIIPNNIPAERLPPLLRNWHLGSRARRHMNMRRFSSVLSYLLNGERGRALDVGCGWGYNLFLLQWLGYEPYGIDIVQDDFYAARRVSEANDFTCNLAGADVSALPFASNTFTAVTSVEMFEHIYAADRMRAAREIYRVLHPGGVFSLSTPNFNSLIERGKRLLVRIPLLQRLFPPMCYPVGDLLRADYHPYRYHQPLAVDELRALIEGVGFSIVETKTMLFTWKNTPDFLFPAIRFVEAMAESIPGIRGLGSTLVVFARKGSSPEMEPLPQERPTSIRF